MQFHEHDRKFTLRTLVEGILRGVVVAEGSGGRAVWKRGGELHFHGLREERLQTFQTEGKMGNKSMYISTSRG